MIGWILLLILLLMILLSFFFRLGALLGRTRDGFFAKLRVGPGYITLFPRTKDPKKELKKKRKNVKAKAKKQKKKTKKAKKQLNLPDALRMGLELRPAISQATGKLLSKTRIDKLDLTWAAEDPADAAILYGRAWAVTETLLDFLENCCVIKERRVSCNLDFYREKPVIYLQLGFSLTLAQLTAVGVVLGVKVLKVFLAHRKTLFKKTAPAPAGDSDTVKGELNHGKEPSHQ